MTPNSRYVITQPLYVLDVDQWKQYALFEALRTPNYTSIEAHLPRRPSADRFPEGLRVDCQNDRIEYYELTLP